ncbi:unnamed protein product [Penicillium olsonii]|uniref:A-pheromone receptor PreA n=1 Tax=Penicillium olsonii TaxID=99116 RepID=A0A9W4HJB5_PENOL|nr:unnamed protein product [Penicillium olsonii]CAG8223696.1 unnamed protein product [Penicillium olsonii]
MLLRARNVRSPTQYTPTASMDVHHRYPLAVVLPTLSFLSIAVGIPPLILLAKNRNYPASSLIAWSIILNLFNFINALCWPTDDVDSWWDGSGLCDIEVKLMVAGYIGVPGALLCIFRSLAIVLDTDRATLVPSRGQRWRNRFMDSIFCVVAPLIAMVTHIVYQKSRYYLFSISGCVNNYDESWVSLVLAYIWPPIICVIAAYYCCLVLIRVRRYRNDFANILRASSSNLSKSRFLRLFFLALSMLVCILPLQGFVLYSDITLALPWHPYSWSRAHDQDWFKIIKVPQGNSVFFDRWTPVGSGFMVFIFFGFGRDATRMYRTIFWYLGLGYCFSSIERPMTSPTHASSPGAESGTTLVGTISYHAKSIFSRKDSTSTFLTHCTYNDIEKGSSPRGSLPVRRWTWLSSLFGRRSRRSVTEEGFPLQDVSGTSNSVLTNAWASPRSKDSFPSPTSSDSNKDNIHVQHVISQQSEVHG